MRARRLVLSKETLTELRSEELVAIAGGQALPSSPLTACTVKVTSMVIECDSNLRPCVSHTCTL